MKDSQPGDAGGALASKYINANNERFSPRCGGRCSAVLDYEGANERFSTHLMLRTDDT